jgi:hypothetical protein
VIKRLKHPATVIAALALFVALGGGAAWASGLISGSQIKNHTIAENKLTKSAINALRGQRGPAGHTGPRGPSNALSTYAQTVNFGTSSTNLVSLNLPAGSYVVMASMRIYNDFAAQNTGCFLKDSNAGNITFSSITDGTANLYGESLSLLAPLTSTGSTVSVQCSSSSDNTVASYTHLVAIQVDSLSDT